MSPDDLNHRFAGNKVKVAVGRKYFFTVLEINYANEKLG